MKLHAIHTCPVWAGQPGPYRIGMEPTYEQPIVVGWCNVLHLTIQGEEHYLLAVDYEDDTLYQACPTCDTEGCEDCGYEGVVEHGCG